MHTKTKINDCAEVQKHKPIHAAIKTKNWQENDQESQAYKLKLRTVSIEGKERKDRSGT
jgi:hypothetical protein